VPEGRARVACHSIAAIARSTVAPDVLMSNPFQLLVDPTTVFKAVNDSAELSQLASRVHNSGESLTPDAWDQFSEKVLEQSTPAKRERAREAHLRFLRAHTGTEASEA